MAFITNLNLTELALIAVVAVMIFGRNLPRVIAELLTHLGKAKRAMREMWRETGIEDEMRQVQNEMRKAQRKLPTSTDPAAIARDAAARWIEREAEKNPDRAEPDADEDEEKRA